MWQQLKRMEGKCAFLFWAAGGQTIKTISGLMQRVWWSMQRQRQKQLLIVIVMKLLLLQQYNRPAINRIETKLT